MTSPAYPDLLSAIRQESQRFREVLDDCDPTARVPACPDWDAADLVWHLAEVQQFWATIVARRPAPPDPDREPGTRPESYPELLDLFDSCSARLLRELQEADPGAAAWHWAPEQTVGATFRRQAHEALIHRLDAEQAAGRVTPLPAELAADGVLECFELMYGGTAPSWARFEPGAGFTEVRLTDLDRSIWTQPGLIYGTDPEDGQVYDGPHIYVVSEPGEGPLAHVSGTAADVDAWLWHRRGEQSLLFEGEETTLAAFRAAVTPAID